MSTLDPPIVARVAIGKAIGLVIGLAAMLVLPLVYPDIDSLTQVGVLLWYPTMGAFIGVFGVLNRHPVLDLPLPWWVRAPLIGGWMNFVLAFLLYDKLAMVLQAGTGIALSPFWIVLEGALVGALIGYIATRYAGDGPEIVTGNTP